MVRAKFQLTEIHNLHWTPVGKRLIFQASYDSTIPEDRRFAQATPSGRFEMQVDNPSALAAFELGKYYYFDATPVEGA